MEYDFRIVNHDRRKVYDWRAEIQFAVNFDIDSSWNGEFSKVDHTLVVIPDEESSVVEKGREKTFGLVMITDDNELAGDYRLSYKLDVHLTESPLFWLLLAGMGLTLTVFIADKINEAKYNKLKNKQEEIRGILQESFETFARIIDAKDPYTRGHSLRVAEYAKLIAGEMGYSEEDRERVYWIGMLHDIGKIGVTDLILQKPGRLD
ncbi:MAG: HD domain-containing protein, partial [Lachnospiraceae bacterium]|nr:HD domain-containing protein [Lachnospiraceae bacterium]